MSAMIPPNETTEEIIMFFDFESQDVDRVTDYKIRADPVGHDSRIIAEGDREEFQNHFGVLPGELPFTVADYWFVRNDRDLFSDEFRFYVEVENETDEEETAMVIAELYEDSDLLDDVTVSMSVPPEGAAQDYLQLFGLNSENVERVTDYVIKARSRFADDWVTVSEGSGGDFRNDLNE